MNLKQRVGAFVAVLVVITGTRAGNTNSVEMTFDSFMGYLHKQHGPLKAEQGSFDIQALKSEDNLPYLPITGFEQTTQAALAYFNRTCRVIEISKEASSLAATSEELKAKIDSLRGICSRNDNDGLDDEALSSLVEFLDIELELFEQIMCLKRQQRLGFVKCKHHSGQIPQALQQLFRDIEPVLQSGARIKEAKAHVDNYCAYLKLGEQRDYARSREFRSSMKMFDDFYQCYCEGQTICGHRLRVAFKQYDEDLGRAFSNRIDAFFKKLEAKSSLQKSSLGRKYSTALGAMKCSVQTGGKCTYASCAALEFIQGNLSVCTSQKPSLTFQICGEFAKEIRDVMKRLPFVQTDSLNSQVPNCIRMNNSKLVLDLGILTSNVSFPAVPFLNFRTSIDFVLTLRYDSTLPSGDPEARAFLNKGWGTYHYGKLAVNSRIETYEFWSRKWSCVSCRRLVEKAFPLSLHKGPANV